MPTDLTRTSLRTLILIWIGWAAIMVAFPPFAKARFAIVHPDAAVNWSAAATPDDPHAGETRGLAAILGMHAAWDSKYYVSIALHGYDDPDAPAASRTDEPDSASWEPKRDHPDWITLNHAFFPLYPWAMRALIAPLGLLGQTPEMTAILAGVIVSLLGTLAAMLALRDLAADRAGKGAAATGDSQGDGLRAAVYLLIWPAGFFLAQVYTEGLFLGLSFGALAMMNRRNWLAAALLAALATWTRSTGALLIVPFAWRWLADGGLAELRHGRRGQAFVSGLLVGAPAFAYLAWRQVFGPEFFAIEYHYFGRGLFAFRRSAEAFAEAWGQFLHGGPQPFAYQLVEFAAIAVGLAASLALWRRDKALALYGLAVLLVALSSGGPMGAHRYVLSLPAIFLAAARLGRREAFDRLWTLGGTLVMGVGLIAFSSGFWSG